MLHNGFLFRKTFSLKTWLKKFLSLKKIQKTNLNKCFCFDFKKLMLCLKNQDKIYTLKIS